MMAFKCDLCGKLYEQYDKIQERSAFNSFILVHIKNKNDPINYGMTYDLCPNCMKDLWNFIDNHKRLSVAAKE